MPLFEIEFCYTQISRGIATVNARSLAQAQAMAEEMDAGDDRISFNPVDGELCVNGVTKTKR
jgi:hypothetical protein